MSDELWDKDCPLYGTEHNSHWIENKDVWGKKWTRCFGWHSMEARNGLDCDARFHAPYLRGVNSNLIHRSTHRGWVSWWPDGSLFEYGPSHIGWYGVKTVCSLPALRNPTLLDAEGVGSAKPYPPPKKVPDYRKQKVYKEIHLCGKCFPINEARTSHPLHVA